MLLSCEFPDLLKMVDVSAIHKGSDPSFKITYRPISVPSAMSKVHYSTVFRPDARGYIHVVRASGRKTLQQENSRLVRVKTLILK